jgi:hypothetical protein
MSRRTYRRIAALLSAVALTISGAAALTATEAASTQAGCCTGFK